MLWLKYGKNLMKYVNWIVKNKKIDIKENNYEN